MSAGKVGGGPRGILRVLALLLSSALIAACSSSPADETSSTATFSTGASSRSVIATSPSRSSSRGETSSSTTITSTSSTKSTPTSGKVAGKPVSFTLSASGDVLTHPQVLTSARRFGGGGYDFTPMFAPVAPALSKADISICQMETPVAATDQISGTREFVYVAPRSMAKALKGAGFDGCSFSSNHTWDQGLSGLSTTRSVLRSSGLEVSGPPSSDGPQAPAVYEVKGVKVANLAYSYTVFNTLAENLNVPDDAPWLRDTLWTVVGAEGILADAKRAKEAGADLVVLSMHWGSEYQTELTDDQRTIARAVLASPYVDAIVGAHAHHVQACDTINGKTVFYGMGNFISNQDPSQGSMFRPETSDGVIVSITFDRDASGTWTQQASFQPTKVDLPAGHVVRPATGASSERTTRTILGLGSCRAGSVRP